MTRIIHIVTILALSVAGFSTPLMINSEHPPSLVASFSGWEPVEMLKAENDWWFHEGPGEPGEFLFYYLIDEQLYIDDKHETAERDGKIFSSFSVKEDYPDVLHLPWLRDYFNPVNNTTAYYAVSVKSTDDISVFLVTGHEERELTYLKEFGGRRFYRTRVSGNPCQQYYFRVVVAEETLFLGSNGFGREKVVPFPFEGENIPVEFFDVPEWSKGAVVYQIFPERFHNGNPSNDPPQVQPWEIDPAQANLGSDGFFGGDLEGVIDKLDYLYDLGVDVIYLNPIFESVSSHKYDTTDYLRVDPHFGDDMVLQDLIYYADLDGIGIVLDGVFNHSGVEFWAFQDVVMHEEESEYVDWFFIRSFPIRSFQGMALSYDGWSGYAHMPKLNVLNPGLQEYFAQVVEKYGRMGISGWRLDVAGEVHPDFWSDFFKPMVKSINPEAIIVGELWGDSRAYLREDMFDSVTNYLFRDAVFRYVLRAENSASRFVSMTNYYLANYPPQVLHSLWNLLGSHDTERIYTAARQDLELAKIMVGLQMTFVGSPMIYYGDEVGMVGGGDPDCRRPMTWEEDIWNKELFSFYNQMIDLRRSREELRTGDYEVLLAEESVLIFRRYTEKDSTIVIVNPGSRDIEISSPITGVFRNLWSAKVEEYSLSQTLTISSRSFTVLFND
ncbi:MAG: Alpha amylase catalytic region [Thermotogales bacterium 46_20]|nr:MAG: Alpha amylase catalytic region [Thermotogales bacterium 46_20]